MAEADDVDEQQEFAEYGLNDPDVIVMDDDQEPKADANENDNVRCLHS